MNKIVWKAAPYACFEVDAIEGWLDEMSQKGLQFRNKIGPLCRFERSPSPARYRMDIPRSEDDRTSSERITDYREMGWDYCSDYTYEAEVFRSLTPDAAELHTDSDLLWGLQRKAITAQLVRCLSFLILAVPIIRNALEFFGNYSLFHPESLLEGAVLWLHILYFLIILMTIALTITAAVRVRRGSKAANAHSPRRYLWGRLWYGLRLAFMAAFAALWVIGVLLLIAE